MKVVLSLLVVVLLSLLFFAPRKTQHTEYVDRSASADGVIELDGRTGALVDEVVFTRESDAGKVTGLIESGAYHVFAQGVTNLTAFHRLRDSLKADYEIAYGTSVELTLNPVEFADGKLNPFEVTKIREALNWLVDRRHIASEIYGGLAVERTLPLNTPFPDYARLADRARALELYYGHNPDRARETIHEEMKKLGATFEGGRWVYNGEQVNISVLIRSEDARARVGDYIANLMEDLGFRVSRQYRTAEEASRIWIASDPSAGQWHIYTGAWVSTVINRDLSDNFSFYYTPRGRPEPLWQAYKPDPELDQIASRLERRDYSSWDERQDMMARGIELAMIMSTRIWLVDQISIGPRASNIALASDLAGGVAGSRLWPYTLRFVDKVGGSVVFAAPNLLVGPWNPVSGSNWLFDTMIMRALDDSPLLPDPFTGLYWPQQIKGAEVTVKEGVPVGQTHDWLTLNTEPEIKVPEDVWIDWDNKSNRFITIGEKYPEGVTSRTRTVIEYQDNYLERKWHDGSTISMADIILPWILTFVRVDENSHLFDPSYLPSFEVFQHHFRGWRILSTSPLKIEVYSDQIYPDAEMIVAQRAPGAQPWHTLALGMMAEHAGTLTFSSNKADRLEVDWMSLVSGPSLEILAALLSSAIEQSYLPYPETLGEFLDQSEINARYTGLLDWYGERKHFWIGDGPFYLHAVYPVEKVVVLRRFEDFPDRSDKWLAFSAAEVPEVTIDGPMMVAAGEVGNFDLEITFQGEPYDSQGIDRVQYLLFDGDGELKFKGEAPQVGEGSWQVVFTAEELESLGSGANSLEVAVTSNKVALPAFASHAFATVPKGTKTLEED